MLRSSHSLAFVMLFAGSLTSIAHRSSACTTILAGKAAGCLTVAVTWGFRSREEIEPTGPERWIDRFEEIHDLV